MFQSCFFAPDYTSEEADCGSNMWVQESSAEDHRLVALRKVYQAFDHDDGAHVGDEELLTLGQARRKLGQRGGAWTSKMTNKLMQKIGIDSTGNVSEHNFALYFDRTLQKDRAEFDRTLAQFMESAVTCAQRKAVRKAVRKAFRILWQNSTPTF